MNIGKVGILVPRFLEHPVESLLHLLPDGVAIRADDHAALDGRVVGEFGGSNNVGVPAGIVFRALRNLHFSHRFWMIACEVFRGLTPCGDPLLFSVARLLVAGLLVTTALLSVVPAPTHFLWMVAIGATELGHALGFALPRHRGGARQRSKSGRIASGLCLLAAVLAFPPATACNADCKKPSTASRRVWQCTNGAKIALGLP